MDDVEIKEKLHEQAENNLRFLRVISKFSEELYLQNKKYGVPPQPLIDGNFIESSVTYVSTEYLKALSTNRILLGHISTALHNLLLGNINNWDMTIDGVREAIETLEEISKNTR